MSVRLKMIKCIFRSRHFWKSILSVTLLFLLIRFLDFVFGVSLGVDPSKWIGVSYYISLLFAMILYFSFAVSNYFSSGEHLAAPLDYIKVPSNFDAYLDLRSKVYSSDFSFKVYRLGLTPTYPLRPQQFGCSALLFVIFAFATHLIFIRNGLT